MKFPHIQYIDILHLIDSWDDITQAQNLNCVEALNTQSIFIKCIIWGSLWYDFNDFNISIIYYTVTHNMRIKLTLP